MVGGSSILEESARAVDSDMVGNDSVGLEIVVGLELRNACSWALLAARSAAAALLYRSLSLGEEEKNCAILLGLLTPGGLLPVLSEEKDGHGIGGELLSMLFDNRRGMARRTAGDLGIIKAPELLKVAENRFCISDALLPSCRCYFVDSEQIIGGMSIRCGRGECA